MLLALTSTASAWLRLAGSPPSCLAELVPRCSRRCWRSTCCYAWHRRTLFHGGYQYVAAAGSVWVFVLNALFVRWLISHHQYALARRRPIRWVASRRSATHVGLQHVRQSCPLRVPRIALYLPAFTVPSLRCCRWWLAAIMEGGNAGTFTPLLAGYRASSWRYRCMGARRIWSTDAPMPRRGAADGGFTAGFCRRRIALPVINRAGAAWFAPTP